MLRLGTLIRLAPRLQSATVVVPPNNNAAAAAAVYVAHSPARRSIAGLAEMLDGNARRSSSNGRGAGLESAPFGTGSVGGGVGGGSGMDGMLHPTALQYGGYGAGGAFGGSSSSSSFSSATGTGTGAGTGTAKLAGAHNGALYCDPVTGEVQWPQPCSVPPEQPGSLFGVTGLCTPADFATATTRTLTECARIVSCIPTVEGPMIVRAMDELSNIICSLSDPCEFIRQNHTNETIRQVAQDTCQTLHAFVDRLNTHRGIQIALDSFINDKATFEAQDYDLRRTAELFMSDFVLHGLHLPEGKERDQVVQLNEEILGQGYLFTREDSPTETFIINSNVYNTLTPSMRSQCRGRNDGNYDAPLAMASNCPDHLPEPTRKRLFIAAAEARPDRLDALVKMLRARYDLAKLLGYPSHVHRVVRQDAYLENPEVLRTFLERLSERIREPVRRDLATLKRLQVNPSQDINPWDLAPLANRLTCVNEDVLEYFSLGNCLTALQEIVRNLFDVELRWVEMQPGELWAPHVYKIAVYHAKTEYVGDLYLDLFSRRGKSDKSANYMIRGSCERLDGRVQLPVVALSCGIHKPPSRQPIRVHPAAFKLIMHEAGHAMHALLAKTRFQHVSGTRSILEVVEFPSTLMELIALDPRTLTRLMRHFHTGQPMPAYLAEMVSAEFGLAPIDAEHQILLGLGDQAYHGVDPPTSAAQATDIWHQLIAKHTHAKPVPGTAPQILVHHLFTYAAHYYVYTWCHAYATLVKQRLFSDDPLSAEGGRRVTKLLRAGGARQARELFAELLGYNPTMDEMIDAFVASLHPLDERMAGNGHRMSVAARR